MTDHRVRWPLTPLPGQTRELLLARLKDVASQAENARTPVPGTTAQQTYVRWANTAVEILNTLIGPTELERLVLTRRYWTIQQAPLVVMRAGYEGEFAAMNHLVTVELGERVRVLDETVRELQELIERWSRPGVFALADTSFYMHYPKKLDEADYPELLEAGEQPIHLLLPILVIDELDRLKRSGPGESRGRAQQTLAILDKKFTDPTRPEVVRAEDFTRVTEGRGHINRGQVTMEVLFDPVGHARLPIPDDEIVDRGVVAQALASREIRFLTCDTNQSLRARFAGLHALKVRSRS